ncbi:hypothetical protein ACFSQE_18625 [Vogesella fluminis]|uniref:Transglutaminase-like domain-containing protein n=1 Tax=Vogesella fluminis TaxID=1069161 RepID=A0ABQ3H7G6_9NEIS|nr:hypothetical protein GCM10011419_07690 [Vogesella fluminis]
MRWLSIALLAALPAVAAGAEVLTLCYHYGCDRNRRIEVDDTAQIWFRQRLDDAADADAERAALQDIVLSYYQRAAREAPIASDRGGNQEDATNVGRMDCLDHSHNVLVLLQLLAAKGWLRHHRLLGQVHRAPLLFDHHAAVAVRDVTSGQDWVIDSWFRDFGAPPVVVPLAIWKEGFSP